MQFLVKLHDLLADAVYSYFNATAELLVFG